jgi:hypothetical protein
MKLICKKEFCERSAAAGQVYCSREHAPYGYLTNRSKRKGGKTAIVNEQEDIEALKSRLQDLAAQGYNCKRAAEAVGYKPGMIFVFAKRHRIKFPQVRGRPKRLRAQELNGSPVVSPHKETFMNEKKDILKKFYVHQVKTGLLDISDTLVNKDGTWSMITDYVGIPVGTTFTNQDQALERISEGVANDFLSSSGLRAAS